MREYGMRNILWLFLSLAITIHARENPFEMSYSPASVGKTTQVQDDRTDFNGTTLTLPSSARILKSASVTFQNLDGSISEEFVAIEQNVDWHFPLVLVSQNQFIQKPVTTVPPSIETKKAPEKKAVETSVQPIKEEKTTLIPPETVKKDATYKLTESISFFINEKEITIFTKESKIRDFLIADPYKVVLDFKKVTNYATKTVEFQKAPFVSATLGDHDGFYRIAILLDGHYRYDLQPFNGGYIIKLK